MSDIPIVSKKYKKLILQVGLNGLSFCIKNTLSDTVIELQEISFNPTESLEDQLWITFVDYPQLLKSYDEILVLHDNNLNTFVPKPFFEEDSLAAYLQYNTKVFETDFFSFDEMEPYGMNNVYVPYVNINNFLIDQFGTFEYKNINTILVSKLLELSKTKIDKQVYVSINDYHFEIVIANTLKLVLYNSFNYATPEDFVYYLLFTMEQLQLNPETITVTLLGKISEENPCYEMAYRFIRNIKILDVSAIQNKFSISEKEALSFYTLLNS